MTGHGGKKNQVGVAQRSVCKYIYISKGIIGAQRLLALGSNPTLQLTACNGDDMSRLESTLKLSLMDTALLRVETMIMKLCCVVSTPLNSSRMSMYPCLFCPN